MVEFQLRYGAVGFLSITRVVVQLDSYQLQGQGEVEVRSDSYQLQGVEEFQSRVQLDSGIKLRC